MGETTAAERERDRRYYAENREKINERHRRYYAANREAMRQKQREWHEANLEAVRERQRQYSQENPEIQRQSTRRYRARLRTAVFDHYGHACACCGSTKRLTMDHVNGDGREHREELFGSNRGGNTFNFYHWLITSGFPDGFQTLCMPCNQSKRAGERCRLSHQS